MGFDCACCVWWFWCFGVLRVCVFVCFTLLICYKPEFGSLLGFGFLDLCRFLNSFVYLFPILSIWNIVWRFVVITLLCYCLGLLVLLCIVWNFVCFVGLEFCLILFVRLETAGCFGSIPI